jgi:hypothetical protein
LTWWLLTLGLEEGKSPQGMRSDYFTYENPDDRRSNIGKSIIDGKKGKDDKSIHSRIL